MFIVDMMAAMEQLDKDGNNRNPMAKFHEASLKNVDINGDQATGVIVGKAGGEDSIGFKKTSAGWLIHMDESVMDEM